MERNLLHIEKDGQNRLDNRIISLFLYLIISLSGKIKNRLYCSKDAGIRYVFILFFSPQVERTNKNNKLFGKRRNRILCRGRYCKRPIKEVLAGIAGIMHCWHIALNRPYIPMMV